MIILKGDLRLGARGILLKETGQIIDLWPSPHLRLQLILNIPSSKRNGCIGKQYPGCKERLLLSAAERNYEIPDGWRMILDQIREVPLTLTHRYSCPGIFHSNRWSTKDILAKEQEAERHDSIVKKIFLSPEEGHIMRHKLVK